MGTTKGPRPTEESNLVEESIVSKANANDFPSIKASDLLLALAVRLGAVLEPSGVLNGDSLAGLGDGAGALVDNSLGNTHFAEKRRRCSKHELEELD